MKVVVIFSSSAKAEASSLADEITGNLSMNPDEKRLMRSVLEADRELIDDAKLISDSISHGITLVPEAIFEQLVRNYQLSKRVYGETLLRELTGLEEDYIENNIKLPEFQRELKSRLVKKIEGLKENGLIDNESTATEKGIELASLALCMEELENLVPKGILGEKVHKKAGLEGQKADLKSFRKNPYRDIAIKSTLKRAIRRGKKEIGIPDLMVFEKKGRGESYVVYALDASGSMKGKKLEQCKKAGIALAYKAISERDKVGLIVFGSDIKKSIEPTDNFLMLIKEITSISASKQTNISKTIIEAISLFPRGEFTKHLVLITDALPTHGDNPEKETLEAVSLARSNKITISLIGIMLNESGRKLAERAAELGEGRLYVVKDVGEIDKVVLEDYYNTRIFSG